MTYCTNCGKKITWLKRSFFFAGTESYTRPAGVQVDIDTEAGVVRYCSEKCRDSDLRRCDWCQKYFSLKKTGVVEDSSASSICPDASRFMVHPYFIKIEDKSASFICPSCSRRIEEVEQVHQELVGTMHSDEELTLLSCIERHPEDPSGYLQLAYYYLDCGKKWQEYLSTRESDLDCKLSQGEVFAVIAIRYDIQPYHKAVKTAFGLAGENFRKAIALGLDSLEEGKTHYWIAYILKHTPKKYSISDPDMPPWDFFPPRARERKQHQKQYEKEIEKDANAALRASVKALKRHLRSNPHDVEALRLLKSAYKTSGKTDELYDIEVRLQKAEVLRSIQEQPQVEQEPRIGRSGIPFEEKCLRLLQQMGFTASSTTSTNDGGIDIIAIHSQPVLAGKYIIQCKDWKSNVGVAVVRELYGVVNAEGANKGILITSSTFTKGAEEFAQEKPLELIDGEQLERLIKQYLKNETIS